MTCRLWKSSARRAYFSGLGEIEVDRKTLHIKLACHELQHAGGFQAFFAVKHFRQL